MISVLFLLSVLYCLQKFKNAVIYYKDKQLYRLGTIELMLDNLVSYFRNNLHRLEVITYFINCLIVFLFTIREGYYWYEGIILGVCVTSMLDIINKLANNVASDLPLFADNKNEDKSILGFKVKLPKIFRGEYRIIETLIYIIIVIWLV